MRRHGDITIQVLYFQESVEGSKIKKLMVICKTKFSKKPLCNLLSMKYQNKQTNVTDTAFKISQYIVDNRKTTLILAFKSKCISR